MKLLLINGPNLNLLGQREPDLYGHQTLDEIEADCRALADALGMQLSHLQSNHEGAIIDAIQAARGDAAGIIINPAAYSHTSVAILDALNAYEGPVIEVHLTNIHRRESFRQNSFVSLRADAVIAGLGAEGYQAAIRRMAQIISG